MSYGTVNGGDTYFASRLHSWDWTNATPADKQAALNQATELIDQFDYLGQKYAVTVLGDDAEDEALREAELSQPNQFPRGDSPDIPEEIDRAAYLIAKALLSGRDPDQDLENLSLKSTSYGDLRSSYERDGNLQEHLTHLIPSPQAWNLIKPFLRERNVFYTKRV